MMPYSRFLLVAILKSLILPCLTIWGLQRVAAPSISGVWIYLVGIPLVYHLRGYNSNVRSYGRARALGADPIPQVRGKWILNLDVMRDWANSSKVEYIGEGMIKSLTDKYGETINTRVLGEDSMITVSPVHATQILSASFEVFEKGPKYYERAMGLFGNGIFAVDGAAWRAHRTSIRPFFKASLISSTSIFEPHASRLISQILASYSAADGVSEKHTDSARREGASFDIQDLMSRFTLDVATDFLFGESVDSLLDGECAQGLAGRGSRKGDRGRLWTSQEPSFAQEQSRKIRANFTAGLQKAQEVVAMRIKIGTLWALGEVLGDKLTKPMRQVRAFTRPIVLQAIADRGVRKNADDEDGRTLLDDLIFSIRTDAGVPDIKAIEDELLNLLVAARDTTASALTSCVYCMAMYPDIFKKLRVEISENEDDPSQEGGEASKAKLPFLTAFINEVLRLYPPVPLNIRRSNKEVLLHCPDRDALPMYMPANASIILATLLIHRSKDAWGPDAEAFDPDRWMDHDERSWRWGPKQFPGCFQAFHYGPRRCLGMQFALHQLQHVLVRLMKALAENQHIVLAQDAQSNRTRVPPDWSRCHGRGSVEAAFVSSGIILNYKGGLHVRVILDE